MAPITDPPISIWLADYPDEDPTAVAASNVTDTASTTFNYMAMKEVKETVRESEETIMMIFVMALIAFLIFQFYRCAQKVLDPYSKVGGYMASYSLNY
jgi:hypothetical protein